MIIAFVGMTHLGLISAVGSAEKGFTTICFDTNESVIKNLKEMKLPIVEPQLPELLEKNADKLQFTHLLEDLQKADIVYVAPDIPTNDQGQSDLSPIRNYINLITPYCTEAILVILSQVPPGFTQQIKWKKENLFYQVETLIFGQAVNRTLFPERFIIGTANPKRSLPQKFLHLLQAYNCPILPMKFSSAELTKIAINMFLVSTVSTTNVLAELCEKMGADWSEMSPALKLDKRIGKYAYLSPGLGISGGNLERDMATFCSLANQNGTDFSVVQSWKLNSQHRLNWVLKKVHEKIISKLENPKLSVLGLAYKKNTSSIKNSPALSLISHLRNFHISCFDPVIKSLPEKSQKVCLYNSIEDVLFDADALIIMTPWDEFSKLSMQDITVNSKIKTIIDPYGILAHDECTFAGLNHYQLGK